MAVGIGWDTGLKRLSMATCIQPGCSPEQLTRPSRRSRPITSRCSRQCSCSIMPPSSLMPLAGSSSRTRMPIQLTPSILMTRMWYLSLSSGVTKRNRRSRRSISLLETHCNCKASSGTASSTSTNSKWSIETTIDQLSKYDLSLQSRIRIQDKVYAITELERDFNKDEYKVKAWLL